jgi:hypothetical protein
VAAPAQPSPFPVVARIPDDQPFTVRPNAGKRVLHLSGVLLITLVPLGCVLGLATVGESNADTGGLLGVVAFVVVLLGALFAFQVWAVTTGGPILAAGPAGLWIKTRPTRGQAIWLPWEAIGLISRRRWGIEKMLCVQARDPGAGGGLGAFTAVDAGITKAFFGTGFTATLNFADRKEAEILQAVAHFAAGRVPLS